MRHKLSELQNLQSCQDNFLITCGRPILINPTVDKDINTVQGELLNLQSKFDEAERLLTLIRDNLLPRITADSSLAGNIPFVNQATQAIRDAGFIFTTAQGLVQTYTEMLNKTQADIITCTSSQC